MLEVMIRSLAPFVLIPCLALAACTTEDEVASETATPTTPEVVIDPMTLDQGLPFDAMPEVPGGKANWEECPYLETQFVADTNGQRMMGLGVDYRFDTPACVFWSYAETPQAQVMVRHMATPEAAKEVVDWAAPIDSTSPANSPEGWTGGRNGSAEGAIYAVQKENVAVVVWSDQQQSVKAESLAVAAIENLGL